jgi:hypothetical protein
MKHPVIAKVSQFVRGGDAREAETALVAVADTDGDLVLSSVIESMPPADIVAILREHDGSRASIIGQLITPEAFLKAVALEARYNDKTHDALRGMINMVIYREDDPDQFIEVLGESEAGMFALVDYFEGRHEDLEKLFQHGTLSSASQPIITIPENDADLTDTGSEKGFATPSDELHEVQDQDWKELAWRLRSDHFVLFSEILRVLRGRARAAINYRQALEAAQASEPDLEDTTSKAKVDSDDSEEDVL